MRIRLRLLGADVIELATGRDCDEPGDDDAIQAVTGSASADLTAAASFGFAQPDDQHRIYED